MRPGTVFEVECPFIREPYCEADEGGQYLTLSWRPGVVWELHGPDDAEPRAHGLGKVIYAVVDVVTLPRPYPARVFFTRRWVSPEGRVFGQTKLRVMTLEAFRRRTLSYRPAGVENYHKLRVEDISPAEREALRRAA